MTVSGAPMRYKKGTGDYIRCHEHRNVCVIIKTATVLCTDRDDHEDEQSHEPKYPPSNLAVGTDESEAGVDRTDLQHVQDQRYEMNDLDQDTVQALATVGRQVWWRWTEGFVEGDTTCSQE